MRKVFLDDLPRYETGKNKGSIKWQEAIGYTIKFIYDDINSEFKIVHYDKDCQSITILYNDKNYTTYTSSIYSCQLKGLLKEELFNNKYRKLLAKKNYVNLINMPVTTNGIDWQKIVDDKIKIHFKYDDIYGEFEVCEYDSKSCYLKIIYNSKTHRIYSGSLIKCSLGSIVGKRKTDYIYNIGDTVKTRTGSIFILEQTFKYNNRGDRRKSYKYKCNKCGNEDNVNEDELFREGAGCNVCCPSPRKVMKGVNDIATKAPWMVEWLYDKDDAYKYTPRSQKSILFRCKECGYVKKMTIGQFMGNGLGCPVCGDGVSYAEKYMIALLKQLEIDFVNQYSPLWIKPKRYDFYISSLDCIIETHGKQHYKETGGIWNSLKSTQDNDKYKEDIAIKNNIKNYIIIDCRESESSFIKNNILNSKLKDLLPLNNVNWEKCNIDASSNLVKLSGELWNKKTKDTKEISKLLNISLTTTLIYLKKAKQLGWCDYDKSITRNLITKTKISGKNSVLAKKTICLNTGQIFDTLSSAGKWCDRTGSEIGRSCYADRNYCGNHPITGEKLRWMYYDEYIKQFGEPNIHKEVC